MAYWYKQLVNEERNCKYGTFIYHTIPFTYKISFLQLNKPKWNYKNFYFSANYDKELNTLKIKCDERFLKYKHILKERIENWIAGYLHFNCDDQVFADHAYTWILGIKYHLILFSLKPQDNKDSHYKIEKDTITIYSKQQQANTKYWLYKIKMDLGTKFFNERVKQLATKINRLDNVKAVTVGEYNSFYGLCSYQGIENNIPKYELKFSIKVLSAYPELLDSLIYHELAHIDQMNHKKDFYDLCHKYCENYTQKISKIDNFFEW